MSEPEETYESDGFKCPYCGHSHYDEGGLDEGVEFDYECESCGKTFTAQFDISYSYTATPKVVKVQITEVEK